ncbi:MAG: hypothetical protein AB8H03_08105 [Saprospiraceae bacterium]
MIIAFWLFFILIMAIREAYTSEKAINRIGNQLSETSILALEHESNCCGAKIIMQDSNGHGKCNECFENCTPRK